MDAQSSSDPIQTDCGCSGGTCGPEPSVSRRDFLKMTTIASAAAMFGPTLCCAEESTATVSSTTVRFSPHLIPPDKNLPAWWRQGLFAKGERTAWKGEELKTIGMPINGIGTGQLYLCGDGTLGQWEIFNNYEFIGYGAKNYARRTIPKPVRHGIALHSVKANAGKTRMLDETGFSNVSFRGEHPIGIVKYEDPDSPVAATLEAFSPFIPLNAADSALPATVMMLTLTNTSNEPVNTYIASWLENPIAKSASEIGWRGQRRSEVKIGGGAGRISLSATALPDQDSQQPRREPILFENFNRADYGKWTVDGDAFSTAPATGNMPTQRGVEGFEGTGLVNSFVRRDESTGKITSEPFTISRRFINFLIGGGDKPEQVGMVLLVDGQPVRRVTGRNSEKLIHRFWDVAEFEGKQARLEIFDRSTEGWGHVSLDQIEFADEARGEVDYKSLQELPDFGTMTWTCGTEVMSPAEAKQHSQHFQRELEEIATWDAEAEDELTTRRSLAMVSQAVALPPGESKTIPFVLTWHFPNTIKPARDCGHEYAARFKDANAVADYVVKNLDRLSSDTRKWRDTWYDSTLPVWLLDRLHLTADCLQTGTTQWWKNGRFWAYEGVVCCEGTCTHVWNYAQSLARLFPELERNVRERQDLGVGLEPSGLVGFRHNGAYAADGQCGTVLKCWREHLMSADGEFLKRNWPNIKKVLNYSIGRDGNSDGLIENSQHNTYDIDFYGANTFVGALYLAALRAGEEMAREMGDAAYADQLRKVFESGRKLSEVKLWNEEYFFQTVDLEKHPEHQYGPGCLSDQMFGQNWAHQTGLGYLYDPAKVKKALESVWKYNWAPDAGVYNEKFPPERPYTEDTEAGLFICTWPHSQHLDKGVRYRDEVWTGIEYQVASGMIYEGLLEEAMATTRAVHDRYAPAKRNPYNEVECSDFYARAMASWGILLALSGYQYHGPKGLLAFAPRITSENFRCAFTVAEGWGTFEQKQNATGSANWNIALRHGKLRLARLELPAAGSSAKLTAKVGGQTIAAKTEAAGEKIAVVFEAPLELTAGQALEIAAV